MLRELHLGLDDTDSSEGGCTTYVARRIAEELPEEPGVERLEPPNLVRLNPTVPWKTRGNGALALRLETPDPEAAFERAVDVVREERESDSDTGLVGYLGDPREDFRDLYERGVTSILERRDVEPLLKDSPFESFGSGRGLIGAAAALAWSPGDYTYELLAYRTGTREVETEELEAAARAEGVWDTLDPDGTPVCVPGTPCPVLLGLRGDSAEGLEEAWRGLNPPNLEGYTVFKTNQGTDDHVIRSPEELEPNRSYRVEGEVVEGPRTIEGGHVFFRLDAAPGELECAAYEPTKGFRKTVRRLREGDELAVYGSLRENRTLNLEKMEVLGLEETELVNPACPSCGNSMASAGRDQGYRCRNCSTHADSKREVKVERELEERFYEVPPSARRHLSKPLIRM